MPIFDDFKKSILLLYITLDSEWKKQWTYKTFFNIRSVSEWYKHSDKDESSKHKLARTSN